MKQQTARGKQIQKKKVVAFRENLWILLLCVTLIGASRASAR